MLHPTLACYRQTPTRWTHTLLVVGEMARQFAVQQVHAASQAALRRLTDERDIQYEMARLWKLAETLAKDLDEMRKVVDHFNATQKILNEGWALADAPRLYPAQAQLVLKRVFGYEDAHSADYAELCKYVEAQIKTLDVNPSTSASLTSLSRADLQRALVFLQSKLAQDDIAYYYHLAPPVHDPLFLLLQSRILCDAEKTDVDAAKLCLKAVVEACRMEGVDVPEYIDES